MMHLVEVVGSTILEWIKRTIKSYQFFDNQSNAVDKHEHFAPIKSTLNVSSPATLMTT